MSDATNWLMQGPSAVKYGTLVDLLEKPQDSAEVATARQEMLADTRLKSLISELKTWPGTPLQRHNDASHLLHKLVFVTDLGYRSIDPGIKAIIERILGLQSEKGAFQVIARISPGYGGSGQDQTSLDVM